MRDSVPGVSFHDSKIVEKLQWSSIMFRLEIYKYAFRAVGCFLGPYLPKRFTEVHINQKSIVNNCSGGGTSSSTGMAAVVIAITRAPYQRKKHTH